MPAKALNRTHCIECGVEFIKGVNTIPNRMIYIQGRCKDCWNKYYNERNKKVYDPIKNREKQLRRNFGMSLEDYAELFDAQSGLCAVCLMPSEKTLHIDHNHLTGEIRALLCQRCNHVIGLLEEDPDIVLKMYEYLRKTTWEMGMDKLRPIGKKEDVS